MELTLGLSMIEDYPREILELMQEKYPEMLAAKLDQLALIYSGNAYASK